MDHRRNEMTEESMRIVKLLGTKGTFDVLSAIQKLDEKAYLNRLEMDLRGKVARATIFLRLKELSEIGFVRGLPVSEPSTKRLVLRYKITKKGFDVLGTISKFARSPQQRIELSA